MLGREKDVGIICVIIYDDLALRKREREKELSVRACMRMRTCMWNMNSQEKMILKLLATNIMS